MSAIKYRTAIAEANHFSKQQTNFGRNKLNTDHKNNLLSYSIRTAKQLPQSGLGHTELAIILRNYLFNAAQEPTIITVFVLNHGTRCDRVPCNYYSIFIVNQ